MIKLSIIKKYYHNINIYIYIIQTIPMQIIVYWRYIVHKVK